MNPPIRPQPLRSITPAIDIYIKLAQYPILADAIRHQMREELFQRELMHPDNFEREVREKAIESQQREGLHDPFSRENASVWQQRVARTRSFLTDAYFANNLGISLLETIIERVLNDQPGASDRPELRFNPEIAPWEILFKQGEIYEALSDEERAKVKHHLEEIKVVLIKGMISDQLAYIGIAKRVFSIADLRYIYERRIGGGKIGGKAAGMMLAWRSLQRYSEREENDFAAQISVPDSYFIGSEVIYDFRLNNRLERFMNQKYLPLEEIVAQHDTVVDAHLAGEFTAEIIERLEEVLVEMDGAPLIVRSSSLLEDNFGNSFAGKYSSYFCPNQGTPEENLQLLMEAIKRVYASTLNPDAILYRQKNELIDYDERMGILLQKLNGKRYCRYFFPTLAGVGFSQNPFRWNKMIRREDGFLRLVLGMGTRAVDRVANDYPRMIGLSHPQLRPESSTRDQRRYAQWLIDVIDTEKNEFTTLPMHEIVTADFPEIKLVASIDHGDFLQDVRSPAMLDPDDEFVLTFDMLTKDKTFVDLMRTTLQQLEQAYGRPVDIEYTLEIDPIYPKPQYHLNIVQCRPLSQREEQTAVSIPSDIPESDIIFVAHDLIPNGELRGVRYIIMVDPRIYRQVGDPVVRQELGRIVSRLNSALSNESFILLGPGRWGSNNLDLGVRVSYADIHNTKALIEMGIEVDGSAPELSYGTHFFQDLVESAIYSIPLHLTEDKNWFNWDYVKQAENQLPRILPQDAAYADYVEVVDVTAVSGHNRRLTILMNGNEERAVAFLEEGDWQVQEGSASLSRF